MLGFSTHTFNVWQFTVGGRWTFHHFHLHVQRQPHTVVWNNEKMHQPFRLSYTMEIVGPTTREKNHLYNLHGWSLATAQQNVVRQVLNGIQYKQ